MIKEIIKPSMIDISHGLMGSSFQKCEKEIIATNIIKIGQWNGDEWPEFTFDEYKNLCKHNVTDSERGILNDFVSMGILSCDDERYVIKDDFIIALREFVKKIKARSQQRTSLRRGL